MFAYIRNDVFVNSVSVGRNFIKLGWERLLPHPFQVTIHIVILTVVLYNLMY
jgi:hypothetical protein